MTFPTIGTHFIGPGVEMVARLTSTASPKLLNEFVASYTTDHIQQINTNPSVWTYTSAFTMPGLFPDFGGKLPGLVSPPAAPTAAVSARAHSVSVAELESDLYLPR